MYLVALGANQPSPAGPPRETLEAALVRLAARGLRTVARSRWYRTDAHPPGSGPDFVNGAARLSGRLEPEAVLTALHAVEEDLGRTRTLRWGARSCDLDLLAAGTHCRPDVETVRRWIGDEQAAAGQATPPGSSCRIPACRTARSCWCHWRKSRRTGGTRFSAQPLRSFWRDGPRPSATRWCRWPEDGG